MQKTDSRLENCAPALSNCHGSEEKVLRRRVSQLEPMQCTTLVCTTQRSRKVQKMTQAANMQRDAPSCEKLETLRNELDHLLEVEFANLTVADTVGRYLRLGVELSTEASRQDAMEGLLSLQ